MEIKFYELKIWQIRLEKSQLMYLSIILKTKIRFSLVKTVGSSLLNFIMNVMEEVKNVNFEKKRTKSTYRLLLK